MWRYVLPTQKWLIGQLSTILKSNLKSDPLLSAKFAHLLTDQQTTQQTTAKKFPLKNLNTNNSKLPNFSNLKSSMLKSNSGSNSSSSDDGENNDSDDEFDVNTDEDDNVLVNKVTKIRD